MRTVLTFPGWARWATATQEECQASTGTISHQFKAIWCWSLRDMLAVPVKLQEQHLKYLPNRNLEILETNHARGSLNPSGLTLYPAPKAVGPEGRNPLKHPILFSFIFKLLFSKDIFFYKQIISVNSISYLLTNFLSKGAEWLDLGKSRPRGDIPRPRSGPAAVKRYPRSKVRISSQEEIAHVQGKEQQLHFAGAAVKGYPTYKVRETPLRRYALREGIRGQREWKSQSQKTSQSDHMEQPCLTQRNYEPCRGGPPKTDGSWQNVVHWRREWQTTSVFLPWEPHEQYGKAKR